MSDVNGSTIRSSGLFTGKTDTACDDPKVYSDKPKRSSDTVGESDVKNTRTPLPHHFYDRDFVEPKNEATHCSLSTRESVEFHGAESRYENEKGTHGDTGLCRPESAIETFVSKVTPDFVNPA